MSISTIFGIALGTCCSVMLLLWLVQVRIKNAGVVDVAWSFLTPLVGAWLILADDLPNANRQWLIIILALTWGFRLGAYLYGRIMNESEDGRYRYMRESSGKHANLAFFAFFQVQATWCLLFALPFWAASRNITPVIGVLDMLGLIIWIIALTGELFSDQQLKNFRNDPGNKGKVCNIGLWRYSRHPNYFFEWLHWWAYVLIGYGSDVWWLTLTGLVIVYVFITRFTGIPHTEEQSLRSRGDAYREYQQSTSKFFPWPPRQLAQVDHQHAANQD